MQHLPIGWLLLVAKFSLKPGCWFCIQHVGCCLGFYFVHFFIQSYEQVDIIIRKECWAVA